MRFQYHIWLLDYILVGIRKIINKLYYIRNIAHYYWCHTYFYVRFFSWLFLQFTLMYSNRVSFRDYLAEYGFTASETKLLKHTGNWAVREMKSKKCINGLLLLFLVLTRKCGFPFKQLLLNRISNVWKGFSELSIISLEFLVW